jgi:ADP-ribose pyrophosphatase
MKIPPQAKRVFKGTIFDVYQWEQELFDGSKATFEMVKRPGTVQIVPVVGDKVLLAYEQQPHYAQRIGLFGGRMEEGEDPLETAKRELREETGLESEDWVLIKEFETGGKIDWSSSYYIAKNCKKVTDPHLDPGEKIEIKEVSFEEFIDTIFQDDFSDKHLAGELTNRQKDQKKIDEFKEKLLG